MDTFSCLELDTQLTHCSGYKLNSTVVDCANGQWKIRMVLVFISNIILIIINGFAYHQLWTIFCGWTVVPVSIDMVFQNTRQSQIYRYML